MPKYTGWMTDSEREIIYRFLGENVERETGGRIPVREMHERYCQWAPLNQPLGIKQIARCLEVAGLRRLKSGSVRYWYGVALKPTNQSENEQ